MGHPRNNYGSSVGVKPEVERLHRQGWTVQEIVQAVGRSRSHVEKIVSDVRGFGEDDSRTWARRTAEHAMACIVPNGAGGYGFPACGVRA